MASIERDDEPHSGVHEEHGTKAARGPRLVRVPSRGGHARGGHAHGAHSHGGPAQRGGSEGRDPHSGHGHGHGHGSSDTAQRVLIAALVITVAFMVVEAFVGLFTGSLALLADAGHMFADGGALALALAAQKFAARPRTERSTFGFRRAEVLAAFVNGMALAGVAVLVFTEAVKRWIEPVAISGGPMLLTAVSGLLVNLVVAAILMRGQRDSINVRAAFAHVVSDALGSVAAILAALSVVVWDFPRADPLLSIAIGVLVAWSGFRIMRETAGILLESAPPHLDVPAVEQTIRESPGVADVHDLHVWRISERFDTLTAHVVLQRGEHGTTVCRTIAERLKSEHGLEHVTIQPEAPLPDELVPVRRSRDGDPLAG
jgi:cobalt-zinc-cadmium efflux system protein